MYALPNNQNRLMADFGRNWKLMVAKTFFIILLLISPNVPVEGKETILKNVDVLNSFYADLSLDASRALPPLPSEHKYSKVLLNQTSFDCDKQGVIHAVCPGHALEENKSYPYSSIEGSRSLSSFRNSKVPIFHFCLNSDFTENERPLKIGTIYNAPFENSRAEIVCADNGLHVIAISADAILHHFHSIDNGRTWRELESTETKNPSGLLLKNYLLSASVSDDILRVVYLAENSRKRNEQSANAWNWKLAQWNLKENTQAQIYCIDSAKTCAKAACAQVDGNSLVLAYKEHPNSNNPFYYSPIRCCVFDLNKLVTIKSVLLEDCPSKYKRHWKSSNLSLLITKDSINIMDGELQAIIDRDNFKSTQFIGRRISSTPGLRSLLCAVPLEGNKARIFWLDTRFATANPPHIIDKAKKLALLPGAVMMEPDGAAQVFRNEAYKINCNALAGPEEKQFDSLCHRIQTHELSQEIITAIIDLKTTAVTTPICITQSGLDCSCLRVKELNNQSLVFWYSQPLRLRPGSQQVSLNCAKIPADLEEASHK